MVAAMLAMLAAPLPLGLLAAYGPERIRAVLVTKPLNGERAVTVPPFDIEDPAPFRTAAEEAFARTLFPRGPVVRATNQVYYDVFASSHAYSDGIVIGSGETLFERAYILAYCAPGLGNDEQRLAHLVDRLTVLDRAMKRLGRPFVFVLTPNKATTLPKAMPPGSCGRQEAPGRVVRVLERELRAAGVSFVNGVALTRGYGKRDPVPPFPRGGTHWSLAVGDRVARQVVMQLSDASGIDLGKVRFEHWRWDLPPFGSDADLANLMNLADPPLDYPTGRGEIDCRPSEAARAMDLHVVGGSFAVGIESPLNQCAFFGASDYYNYYRNPKGPEGWREALRRPSALIVELNEYYLASSAPSGWLDRFFDDILPAVADAPESGG